MDKFYFGLHGHLPSPRQDRPDDNGHFSEDDDGDTSIGSIHPDSDDEQEERLILSDYDENISDIANDGDVSSQESTIQYPVPPYSTDPREILRSQVCGPTLPAVDSDVHPRESIYQNGAAEFAAAHHFAMHNNSEVCYVPVLQPCYVPCYVPCYMPVQMLWYVPKGEPCCYGHPARAPKCPDSEQPDSA